MTNEMMMTTRGAGSARSDASTRSSDSMPPSRQRPRGGDDTDLTDDEEAIDLAAAIELSRKTKDWTDLTYDRVATFLLAQGLVHDTAEASQRIEEWEIRGLLAPDFSIKVASGEHEAATLTLDEARSQIASRWPGMHQLAADEVDPNTPICPGDSIAIACNGQWMSSFASLVPGGSAAAAAPTRFPPSAHVPAEPMVPGKSQDTSSTLSSIHELSSLTDAHPNAASAFHVVSSEKLGITRRIDSETVEYGDLVFLQTASGCTLPVIFVCPGRTGPVCRGHHVFMIHLSVQGRMRAWVTSPQSTTRSGALQLVDDPNDFNRAPTCFTLRSPLDAGAVCQSGTGSKRARTEKRPLPAAHSQRQPSSQPGGKVPLQVISHNVWLEPKLTSSWQLLSKRVSPRKRTRAHAIPDALQRAISRDESNASNLTPDVIVITGAFCSTATGILRARLKRDLYMPFESPVLDHAGIFISSRFPIERAALFRFDASQKDRSVSRAAIYVRVRKQGKCVHLFAANVHPGTSTSTMKIRESQLCALRQWIQNLRLPEDEPVLIAGDLRTCRASQHDAYERMLDILGAEDAAHIPSDLLATIQTSCQDINAMLASTKSFAARWSSSSRTSNARGSSSTSSSSTASSAALAPSSDAVTMSTPRRPATVYSLMEPAIRNVLTVNPACNALTMRLGRGPSLADTILISRKHGIAQDPDFQVLTNAATAIPYSITSQAEASDLSTHYPVALSLSL